MIYEVCIINKQLSKRHLFRVWTSKGEFKSPEEARSKKVYTYFRELKSKYKLIDTVPNLIANTQLEVKVLCLN
jgi:hypothetical protein